jgi:hypothetical protein
VASLRVVGTGIKAMRQVTFETAQAIAAADVVLYGVCDSSTEDWIRRTNPRAEALTRFYADGKPRIETYGEMIEAIIAPLRGGQNVCAAFYGHPGVFVYPSHVAIRTAREEGYDARMMPAVSAEDCLFADLGFDPGYGYTAHEATDFLICERAVDPSCALILWQVDCVGDMTFAKNGYDGRHVPKLVDYLLTAYPPSHRVAFYMAPVLPFCKPRIDWMRIDELAEAVRARRGMGTLFVPPATVPEPDLRMLERLGLAAEDLHPYRGSAK